MTRRNSSFGFFGMFGRSSDLRLLDKALRDVDLHPALVPEGVKLTVVNLMKDHWPHEEPPETAYLPIAGLFAYCVVGADAFSSVNGEARLADVEQRMEAALEAEETLDAQLILLAMHSGLVNPQIVDIYELSLDDE